MGLLRVFAQPHLLEAHLLDLLFELAVFRPHPAQEEIVVPEIAGVVLRPHQCALERSDRIHCPDTDQTRVLRVPGALDLDRESQHLQK